MKTISNPSGKPYSVRKTKIDNYISSLDPLCADEKFKLLPDLNRNRNTKELIIMLSGILPSVPEILQFDYYQAVAAVRDIGIVLGSLKRHGIEPEYSVADLGVKLKLLGEKTDLPPRDTLIHYTVWNPDGERLRTYTGTSDEKHLIESVKIAMTPLVHAIKDIRDLYFIAPASEEFSILCEKVKDNLEKMVKAIVHAKKNVSTYYFATELRMYFDPITLDDREYLGPGAVEMPLFVFDHILWGADCEEEEYVKFKNTYLPYVLPEMRVIFNEFSGSKSLLTKISSILDQAGSFDQTTLHSVKRLKELCLLLKSFRSPHKKLAEESYNHEGETNRQKGSGGYQTDILAYIMKINFERIDHFEKSMQRYITYSHEN